MANPNDSRRGKIDPSRLEPFDPAGRKRSRPKTVSALCTRYEKYAGMRYRDDDGNPTGHVAQIRAALRAFRAVAGKMKPDDVTPTALKHYQQQVANTRRCRTTCNHYLGNVKAMLKWAASEELIAASVYHAALSVRSLRRNESNAVEPKIVTAIDDESVAAILSRLTPPVRAMVELQALTGIHGAPAWVALGYGDGHVITTRVKRADHLLTKQTGKSMAQLIKESEQPAPPTSQPARHAAP